MFNKLSIKFKLIALSVSAIIIVAFIVGANAIFSINNLADENIDDFKDEAYQKTELALKNYVSIAMTMVDSYYQRTTKANLKKELEPYLKHQTDFLFSILEAEYNQYNGKIAEAELKQRLLNIISSTKYEHSGYFWVSDTNAYMLKHPDNKFENQNLYNFEDTRGKQIFKEFVDVALKSGEGFIEHAITNPATKKEEYKITQVKLFQPYGWVIGTGEYVSNVENNLKAEALKALNQMQYNGDYGYYFVINSEAVMVNHPNDPGSIGKSVANVQDNNGKNFYKEFVVVSNQNSAGGVVDYLYKQPDGKIIPKMAYAQKFGPWDWIIGTGANVDDIEAEIADMISDNNEGITKVITSILIYIVVSIFVLYFITSFLLKKAVITPLQNLNGAVKNLMTSKEDIKKSNDDEIGNIVDSFNVYLNVLKENAKQDSIDIKEIEDVISKVNNGFYSYRIMNSSNNESIERLRLSINDMIEKSANSFSKINENLIEFVKSNYKLKHEVSEDSGSMVASLAKSTALVAQNVSEFLCMINSAGDSLNQNTKVLSQSANALATSANEQAASLEETAAALEQITSNVKQNNENVVQMSTLANDLNDSAKIGQSLATRTTQAMEDIDTQVNSINDAITVIDQIAFQTNILSLNAAVEAATAGEAGKGFAVVAQEVRNLASRSAEAAKEIKAIVESATNKANEGKLIADEMISGYSELNQKISQTIDLISDVSNASKEQELGIVQINDTVTLLDQATQVNASSATNINRLSEEVRALSDRLINIANKADYDRSKSNQTDDVDMVFQIAKLKNDHIVFKNNNFSKLAAKGVTSWRVTNENECNLGKWINEQELKGVHFTKTEIWKELKEYHEKVHGGVQKYIDQNSEYSECKMLEETSHDLEVSMSKVFHLLDEIKIINNAELSKPQIFTVNVKKNDTKGEVKNEMAVEKKSTSPKIKIVQTPKPKVVEAEKKIVKPVVVTKEVKQEIVKPVTTIKEVPKKLEVITSKIKDDDEWESF